MAATRRLIYPSKNLSGYGGALDRFEAVQYLDFQGRTVVYCQAWTNGRPYAIVHGYNISEPFVPEDGTSALDINLISSVEEREEIRTILASLVQGPINFW